MFDIVLLSSLIVASHSYPSTEDKSSEYKDSLQYPHLSDKRNILLHHKEDQSLDPATTYHMPLQPLEFIEKMKKKPKGKHLKTSRLLKKMGDDFTSVWMSVRRPPIESRSKAISLPESQVAKLMEEVSDLALEDDIREMLVEGEMGETEEQLRHEPTVSRAVGAFQKWLVKKSSCPVEFQWEDLGEFFWPRYIRKGECQEAARTSNSVTASCSWPRGMSCNPSGVEILQILRWHCRRRRTPDLLGLTTRQKIRKSYKCRWIKVPYPVTSSCKCE